MGLGLGSWGDLIDRLTGDTSPKCALPLPPSARFPESRAESNPYPNLLASSTQPTPVQFRPAQTHSRSTPSRPSPTRPASTNPAQPNLIPTNLIPRPHQGPLRPTPLHPTHFAHLLPHPTPPRPTSPRPGPLETGIFSPRLQGSVGVDAQVHVPRAVRRQRAGLHQLHRQRHHPLRRTGT